MISVQNLLLQLRPALPEQMLGLYLYGSAVRGGLGPHSDVDLLAVVSDSLRDDQRRRLTEALLSSSGWAGHAERFPEAAERRPIEFTALVLDEVRAWPYPPTSDFQYGEWMRAEITAGSLPARGEDPDVVLLLADARQHHVTLLGEPLDSLVPAPEPDLLRTACRDALPSLLAGLREDTRNVLLTLARMSVTIQSGEITSKDDAGQHIGPQLPEESAALLRLATAEHRGETVVDWDRHTEHASAAATALRRLVSRQR